MVKAVVDVERELIAVDAELHSDLESLLLEDGSKQKDLCGIKLYPELVGSAHPTRLSLLEVFSSASLTPIRTFIVKARLSKKSYLIQFVRSG